MDLPIDKMNVQTSMQEIAPLITGLIKDGIPVSLTVTGNSMFPLFRHNKDKVVLVNPDNRNLKKGDIPLYKRDNGQYILHRIVGMEGNTYKMAGDAQTDIESGIRHDNIIAVVSGFYRNGKYISCENTLYKIYTQLWLICLPIRKYLVKVCRHIIK